MALSKNEKAEAVSLADELIDSHKRSLDPQAFHGKIRRYLAGDQDLPYMPKGAKKEYLQLARKSRTNLLPLISDTYTKALFVEGYRGANDEDNAAAWEYWQANKLDARQSVAIRGALEYGASYVLVLPGSDKPLIRPLSPLRTHVLYEDEDDEYPVYALVSSGQEHSGKMLYRLYAGGDIYTFRAASDKSSETELIGRETHGLGVVPLVRFRDRLDGQAVGVIWPHITSQDQINETVFARKIAIQYASHRQRWATGLVIPRDEQEKLPDGSDNPNFGQPIEPFENAIDRLWTTDNPDAKFGEFGQTDVRGHIDTFNTEVRTLSSMAQISPLMFLGDLVNLSGDALAAIQATTTQRVGEYETIMGESWEQVLQLASVAAGTPDAADVSAQVRWRGSDARSLQSTVEALAVLAEKLGVPVQELWERVPGVSDQDVERWKAAAEEADGLGLLAQELSRQSQPVESGEPEEV